MERGRMGEREVEGTQGTVMQFVVEEIAPLSTKVPVDQRWVPSRRVHSTRQAEARVTRAGRRVVGRMMLVKMRCVILRTAI